MTLRWCELQFILIAFSHRAGKLQVVLLSIILLSVQKCKHVKSNYSSSRRAVFNLTVHMVFLTKYRRKVITKEMVDSLRRIFKSVLNSWDLELIEFNGESDPRRNIIFCNHVHLLVYYPPHKLLSSMIANLKKFVICELWMTNFQEIFPLPIPIRSIVISLSWYSAMMFAKALILQQFSFWECNTNKYKI